MKIGFSKFISHLFFVIILLLSVQGLAFAGVPVELTQKYSFTDGPAGSASTSFWVENLDLETYKKYNRLLSSGKGTTTMLAKAKPNALFAIVVGNKNGLEIDYAHAYFSSLKVAKGFPDIKGQQKTMKKKDRVGGGFGYTIPKGVEMVYVSTAATYNVYGTNKAKFNVGPYLELFIFTSDDAFQRAYAIFKEQGGLKKTAPAITNTTTGKAAGTTKPSNTKAPANSKDSGMSTTTMVGGAAALGALGWGALKFFGGGGGAAAGGAAAGASVPNNPYYKKDGEDLIYTDPATGAQSIYSQDDNGNWVNQETGGVLDVSRADEAVNERLATKKWVENQRTKESETTKTLKELDRKLAEENEKITRETARDKIAVKTGSYGLTPEEKRVRFEEIKSKEQEKIAHYTSRGNTFAAGENIAKVVEYTADVAMDGLGAVGGPAKAITEGYKVVKSAAKGASESLVNAQGSGKTIKEKLGDMAGAAFKGGVNGVIDAVEYHVGGAGLKTQMAVNVVGDMLKGGLDAAYKGESIVKAAAKGAVSGTLKVGVNQAGAALGKKVAAKDLSVFRDKYNTIKNSWSKDLSEKTIDHHIKMTATKHVMTKSAHTVEMGMGKSVIKRGIGTMLK